MEIINRCFCIGNLTMEKHKCQHCKHDIDSKCESEKGEKCTHLTYPTSENSVSKIEIMAHYDRMNYLRRLGVRSQGGVYTFTFDEGDDVHDQLVGDLAMEYGKDMPKDGDTIHIIVKNKKIVGMSIVKKEGGRRKTRRRKTKRLSKK